MNPRCVCDSNENFEVCLRFKPTQQSCSVCGNESDQRPDPVLPECRENSSNEKCKCTCRTQAKSNPSEYDLIPAIRVKKENGMSSSKFVVVCKNKGCCATSSIKDCPGCCCGGTVKSETKPDVRVDVKLLKNKEKKNTCPKCGLCKSK